MNLLDKEKLIRQASEELEGESAESVLQWAVERFPNITLACSFGAEDVVLVDLLNQVSPRTDIFYLDTDLHFKETYETRDRLEERYGKPFLRVEPRLSLQQQADAYGDRLWASNPNQCCAIRKVDPLAEVLSKYDAWITGIRREQAPTRANAKKIEYDVKFGLVKFNPLADWTSDDIWSYIRTNNIIYNPLHDAGYPSIGCEKCTRPVREGEDPRAGRWSGFEKTECGLHK
ncbi:phosphoadenylyl-sulfate reductase [Paenibacillus sp. J2TS4]|uniref:phosphoadenylyl-sulfate reductase n=1 Tax=Paenibacillus sp. J2TS4 TaxID=2807194 RepID=UPI001B08F82E|nr:phosphoadenylyl-sulfate reductase [Paenibacillus sp. J2TS4]GIP36297.1 phosphoadenosine phosphosulfate reductase [Paenibacillus sp. J2TS4]